MNNRNIYAPLTYNYISADPGAGKTQLAINEYIPKMIKTGYSVMMVVPSIQLANEISKNSKGSIKAIHSESVDAEKTVLSQIINIIRTTYKTKEPQSIVICEASYMNAVELFSVFEYMMQEWVVIKDEPRDPLNIFQVKISNDVKKIINKFIGGIVETDMRLLSAITPLSDNTFTQEYLDTLTDDEVITELFKNNNKKDDNFSLDLDDIDCGILGQLVQFKKAIYNRFNEVLISTDAYNDHNILQYSVFQQPLAYSMFAQAIFLKANFEDSFVYHQWYERGVTWKQYPKTFKKMSSDRINIHYFYGENSMWSKSFRTKDYDGINNFELYLAWVRDELPHGGYVYVANNSYSDTALKLAGTRMPAECHGLNSFSNYTNVVLCASYLVHGQHEPFYAYYNSSTTDALAMRQTQYHIQQITRTDIRNYDSNNDIHVYVPGMSEALALLAYFPNATLIDPNGEKTGQLSKSFQPTLSVEQYPTNNLGVYGNSAYDKDVKTFDVDEFEAENLLTKSNTKNHGHPHLQLVLAKHSTISNVGLCKITNKKQYEDVKKSLPYICAGIFNDGDRLLKDNCQGAKMIGFDLDDTTLTDAQLAKIMGQVEYVRYTTFSHKDNKVDTDGNSIRRIRIIAPYSRPVTVTEHDRIVKYYLDKLWKVLYPDTKFTPENLKESCIDIDKSKAYAKLFAPHLESDVLHIKRKRGNKTIPINVDEVLAQVPPLPKVQLPTSDDIVWKSTATVTATMVVQQQTKDQKLIQKCLDIIATMHGGSAKRDGNRSSLAVKVAGIMTHIDPQYHDDIFYEMEMQGVDKAAMKQAKKYAGKSKFRIGV